MVRHGAMEETIAVGFERNGLCVGKPAFLRLSAKHRRFYNNSIPPCTDPPRGMLLTQRLKAKISCSVVPAV